MFGQQRGKNADIGINLVVGLKLLKNGDYGHALDFLKKYAELDAKIGTAVAYCHFILSLREFKKEDMNFILNALNIRKIYRYY